MSLPDNYCINNILPNEIIVIILDNIDGTNRLPIYFVCHLWKNLAKSSKKNFINIIPNWVTGDFAELGSLKLVEWSYFTLKYPLNELTCAGAVRANNMKLLEWLHEKNCKWDNQSCYIAAGEGNFDILKWLVNNKCPMCGFTYNYAIDNGHVEIAEWLKSIGCPTEWPIGHGDGIEE